MDMRKTEAMQTRNGVIYFPLEDRKREDWRVEIIQNATVVDVLLAVAAVLLAALLLGAAEAVQLFMGWQGW